MVHTQLQLYLVMIIYFDMLCQCYQESVCALLLHDYALGQVRLHHISCHLQQHGLSDYSVRMHRLAQVHMSKINEIGERNRTGIMPMLSMRSEELRCTTPNAPVSLRRLRCVPPGDGSRVGAGDGDGANDVCLFSLVFADAIGGGDGFVGLA